jgi:4-hydroxythreonine-4-phosphate dehydrogenase
VTVLIQDGLKAALLTTHCSLLDACKAVKEELILERLTFIDRFGSVVGAARPRIAVAALNPHGGEGGMLGTEEIDEIVPAVERARTLGVDVHGPFPVNGILAPYRGGYDFVLAMYHDQAVAAMDMLRTTTLTLGLPFIRTSVGHGTGLDIAGKGVASAVPLDDALTSTVVLARASVAAASGSG